VLNTVRLFEEHPPEDLKTWCRISKNSVLKTARWPDQVLSQTLGDGKEYFEKQVWELQRSEQRKKMLATMRKYRRPAQTVGLAVLVGVLAVWLRRYPGPTGVFGAIWRYWAGYYGH